MNMWVDNSHIPDDFLLMTYEEIHSDPLGGFGEMLAFVGIDADPRAMKSAVKESSFQKMKKMELQGSLNEPWMKPGSKKSENSMKIRKGTVGGYKEELSQEDIKYLNNVIRNTLSPRFPYSQN
jgi:hypothetical protein